jgi:hypothetical protein
MLAVFNGKIYSFVRKFFLKDEMKGKFFFIGCWACLLVYGQDPQIILGPDEIAENQVWTITITVHQERLREYDPFPDIEGFRKGRTSTSSHTSIINGQISTSYSLIMSYLPAKQGIVVVPPFTMHINGKAVSSPGKRVKVGPPIQTQQRDPFQSFFDRYDWMNPFSERTPAEFIDVKEDAFLALTTSKDEVYAGEGFNTVLAFYVAETNQAAMEWHDINRQFTEILRKIKPQNCWEENFNQETIEGIRVELNGKPYTQYKLYQATFYPLTTDPVVFPSLSLEMIKYKIAKNPSFFGNNRQRDFKTFRSRPKTVRVKPLPEHPLRQVAAVGNYRLKELVHPSEQHTGGSLQYEFTIYGEGNIGMIQKPSIPEQPYFDIFDPTVHYDIRRENNRVHGSASFVYFLIPKEPGTFNLGDFFQWYFFNPETSRYDTLKAKTILQISGESLKNESIASSGETSFYSRLATTDNSLQQKSWLIRYPVVVHVLALVVLAGSLYGAFFR